MSFECVYMCVCESFCTTKCVAWTQCLKEVLPHLKSLLPRDDLSAILGSFAVCQE